MIDFFKDVLTGATILIQSVGFMVGIRPGLPISIPSPGPVITVSPSPSSSPNMSPKVDKTPNNTNNNQKSNQQTDNTLPVTQDSNRKGRIIEYKEYCKGGQETSIYEGELLTKKAEDGNTYSMTKDDWNCYEKSLSERRQVNYTYQAPSIQNNPVKINCSFSSGEYGYNFGELTYDECKIKSDTYWASKRQTTNTPANNSLISTPTPSPVISNTSKTQIEIDRCKSEVRAKYDSLVRGCNIRFGDTSGVYMCKYGYGQEMNKELSACN